MADDQGLDLCSPKGQKHYDFIWSDADITVFGGSAGSGKAQPLDAKVLTPSGWDLMGNIKVGSKVTTPDGGVANVTAVYPFHSKPVYRLELYSGISTKACDEHLWKAEVHSDLGIQEGIYTTQSLIRLSNLGCDIFIPVYDSVKKTSFYKQLMDISYVGDMPAQCISIDSEDHLYITDDYIVTHNTWQGLCRFLRFINEPEYIGYVIRKTQASLKHGAFKTAIRLFTAWESKIKVNRVDMTITFPSGAVIIFKGLDGTASIEYFQGQEISGALVDEATHIKYEEISWLMTRLRTNANVNPTVWFTCNPDPDHFIAEWVDPYLYPKKTKKTIDGHLTDVGGRVDPEINGRKKWYYVIDGHWYWNDDREKLIEEWSYLITDPNQKPMSFRFIGATFQDNPVLVATQPAYINSLMNKQKVEKERLAYGNWYIREEGAGYWRAEWVKVIKKFPHPEDPDDKVDRRVRCWDIAYTVPHEANPDPDYTASVLMFRTKHGYYVVEHVTRARKRIGELYKYIAEVAKKDYEAYGIITQYIPEDPAAGKLTFQFAKDFLRERGIFVDKVKGSQQKSKLERFKNFASASENSAVMVIDTTHHKDPEANWNEYYFTELEVFDGTRNTRHDDMVDATSDGFNVLYKKKRIRKNIAGNMF